MTQNNGASASIPNADYVRDLLPKLVSGGDSSCLNGTPMIPLHKDTVKMLADMIEAPIYPPICGYPLKGWQLRFVKYDEAKDGQPNGWLVKLQREGASWIANHREYNVMARSDLGPLEAWEEAIRIARRCDERGAATPCAQTQSPIRDKGASS